MILKRNYGMADIALMSFTAAPVASSLCVLEQLASALLPSVEIVVTARFVDTALAIFNGQGGDILTPLVLLMVIVACRLFLPGLVGFAKTKRNISLTETFRVAVAEKRAKLEYRHIEDNGSWELIRRVGADPAGRIAKGFDDSLVIARVMVQLASVLVLLAVQVWWAALLILSFATPLLYLAFRTGKINYLAEKEAVKHDRRAGYLQDVLTGRDYMEERSLFGYTGGLNETWYDKYEAARKIRAKAHRKLMISLKGSSLIILLTTALIIGVLFAPLGSGAISVGMFMGFVTAVFNLTFIIGNELVWFTGQLATDREYLKDLAAFSCLSEQAGALSVPEGSVPEPALIELVNVSFRYPGTSRDVLKNLSLKFLTGGHYALVGANGAGKTTIAKLLTGLYTNYEGEILIDGTELRSLPAARIKALFHVVYQDFAKYQIPLKDAVALGAVTLESGADEEAARDALEKIGMGSLPTELPRGMDTSLGRIREGSVDISGGQWQRIAIARSLVSPAPVHILDEPTASLDPVAESALYELYGDISRGKTTVVITHRLGAARLADEILVIDGGCVAERGSHDALAAAGGLYAAMYESQQRWYQHENG